MRGRLLVAQPAMIDPNFNRSVILMIEHNDEGSLGLVLNRTLDLDVGDALPGLVEVAAPPRRVHVGGPVGQGSALALAEVSPDEPSSNVELLVPVHDTLGLLDLGADDLGVGVRRARLFSGYSGWGPGQLDAELADDGWFVVDAEVGDAFAEVPGELWYEVLGRQGGALGRLANYPPAPWVN